MNTSRCHLTLIATVVLASAAFAQGTRLITVTVTDPWEQVVTNLGRGNFRIFEDNVEQQVTSFSVEDRPMSIGFVIDTSRSMRSEFGPVIEALNACGGWMRPKDEFFLVESNEQPQVAAPFTRALGAIDQALSSATGTGQPALLDGLYLAEKQMRSASNARKVIVAIFGGWDDPGAADHSHHSEREIKDMAADTAFYGLQILQPLPRRSLDATATAGMSDICSNTGGLFQSFERENVTPEILRVMARLRNSYTLGYTPTNQSRDGKYRRVRVKVIHPHSVPRVIASYPQGYYGPPK